MYTANINLLDIAGKLLATAGRNNGEPMAVRKIAAGQASTVAGSGRIAVTGLAASTGLVSFLESFSATILPQSRNASRVNSFGVVGGLLCSLYLLCVIILLVLLTGDASY